LGVGNGTRKKNAREEGRAFVRENKTLYPVALDREGNVIRRFHVDNFPDYYLIDHQGKIRMANINNGQMDKAVQSSLPERNAEKRRRKH
jgi:hypothetical protein